MTRLWRKGDDEEGEEGCWNLLLQYFLFRPYYSPSISSFFISSTSFLSLLFPFFYSLLHGTDLYDSQTDPLKTEHKTKSSLCKLVCYYWLKSPSFPSIFLTIYQTMLSKLSLLSKLKKSKNYVLFTLRWFLVQKWQEVANGRSQKCWSLPLKEEKICFSAKKRRFCKPNLIL